MKNKKNPKEIFKKFLHVGIVVRDLDKTLNNLTNIFGIGPFRIEEFPPKNDKDVKMTYHGEPANFSAKFCFAEIGNVEIEIIQPISGQSIWFDFLEKRGEGIHHLKFLVPGLEETEQYLHDNDLELTQVGSAVGPNKGRYWGYIDSEDQFGFVLEILTELNDKQK